MTVRLFLIHYLQIAGKRKIQFNSYVSSNLPEIVSGREHFKGSRRRLRKLVSAEPIFDWLTYCTPPSIQKFLNEASQRKNMDEIDEKYEFNAPKFIDFLKGDQDEDADKWFGRYFNLCFFY